MREIKFRAWCLETKKWLTFPKSNFNEDHETILELNVADNCVLMQYTGLKDKNGKEIFESDILCIVEDVVVDVIGGYERTEPEGKFFTVEWKDAAWFIGDEMLWEWAKDSEIIGNIYQSPNLLTNSAHL